jgi:uncharacterized membrane protein YqjE
MRTTREAGGIVADVRGLASGLVRAFRTRLELVSIELAEEKAWLVRFTFITVAALHLFAFGLLLAIFAVVLAAAEPDRPAILAGCAALFLAAGVAGGAYLYRASRRRHPFLQHTIAVLSGDEKALSEPARAAGDD